MTKKRNSHGAGMLEMLPLKPTREEKEPKQPIVNDRDAIESVVEFGGLAVPKTIILLWSTIWGILWMNVALQPLPPCLLPSNSMARVLEMLKRPGSLRPGIPKTQFSKQMRNEKGREKPIAKDRDGIESVVVFMPRVIFLSWTTI